MGHDLVRCAILGQTEIAVGGIRLTPEAERQYGVALYFCANAGRDVSRDDVAELFWPEHDGEAARHCLRQTLYRLRVLGVPVRSGAKSITLDERAIEADHTPVVVEGAPPSAFLAVSDVTVLPGYVPRFSAPFGRWVEDFRSDVSARMRRGLVRVIADLRGRGRYTDVERLARQCLVLDPLNEEATLALAEAIALAGGKAEAVKLIDKYQQEIGHRVPELRIASSFLRERIADNLVRSYLSPVDLPLVGRSLDVERFSMRLQRLKVKQGFGYIIWGQSGIGKTRLAEDCCRVAEVQGVRVVAMRTQPSNRSQSLSTISDLVPTLMSLPGALGAAPAALDCLRGLSSPAVNVTPTKLFEHDGEARFAHVRWSILDLLDAIVAETPLLIHLDDAQDADRASEMVLQDLLRTFQNRPLAFLFTLRDVAKRPGDTEAPGFLDSCSLHRLTPLEDASAHELTDLFLERVGDNLEPGVREKIVRIAAGNPLFLIELLKHRRDLASGDGTPASVHSLIQQRIHLLSSAALRVLQTCAVLSTLSTLARLERAFAFEDVDVLSALSELEEGGLIVSRDDSVLCRHDAIRDAAVQSTPTAALRLLHRRVARLLTRELLHKQRVSHLWQCMHHWNAAGTPAKGRRIAIALSNRLLRAGLPDEALRILKDIEPKCELRSNRLRVLSGIARGARMLRDWDQLLEAAGRRRALIGVDGTIDPPHSSFELLEYEARLSSERSFGQLPDRILHCINDKAASIRHRLDAAVIALMRADNDADANAADNVFSSIGAADNRQGHTTVPWLTSQMIYHSGFGDLDLAYNAAEALARKAALVGQPVGQVVLLRRAAYTYRRTGHFGLARGLCLQALENATRLRLYSHLVPTIELLTAIALDEQDYTGASRWLREAKRAHEQAPDFYSRAVAFGLEARLAFETQDTSVISGLSLSMLDADSPLRLRRPLQAFLVSKTAVQVVRRSAESLDGLVAQLLELHSHLASRGLQDFPVSVLLSALCDLGRSSEAAQVLTTFMRDQRRDRSVPSGALSRFRANVA